MSLIDWTYVSGVIAVAETRLLTDDEFLDFLRQPTLQALIQRIKQVETYAHMPAPDSPETATRTVEREMIRSARTLSGESPDASMAEVILIGRMFAELRSFVRGRLFPDQAREETPEFFTNEELEALWNDGIHARKDLADAVRRLRGTLDKSNDAAELVDLLIDREELVCFLNRAGQFESQFIRDWAMRCVRLRAALVVVRARLSGEKPERLLETFLGPPLDDEWLLQLAGEDLDRMSGVFAEGFEPPDGEAVEVSKAAIGKIARMIDDRLTLDAAEAKLIPFGPERLFGYLRALDVENLNLRLITETLVVEGDHDEARARLRRSYAG